MSFPSRNFESSAGRAPSFQSSLFPPAASSSSTGQGEFTPAGPLLNALPNLGNAFLASPATVQPSTLEVIMRKIIDAYADIPENRLIIAAHPTGLPTAIAIRVPATGDDQAVAGIGQTGAMREFANDGNGDRMQLVVVNVHDLALKLVAQMASSAQTLERQPSTLADNEVRNRRREPRRRNPGSSRMVVDDAIGDDPNTIASSSSAVTSSRRHRYNPMGHRTAPTGGSAPPQRPPRNHHDMARDPRPQARRFAPYNPNATPQTSQSVPVEQQSDVEEPTATIDDIHSPPSDFGILPDVSEETVAPTYNHEEAEAFLASFAVEISISPSTDAPVVSNQVEEVVPALDAVPVAQGPPTARMTAQEVMDQQDAADALEAVERERARMEVEEEQQQASVEVAQPEPDVDGSSLNMADLAAALADIESVEEAPINDDVQVPLPEHDAAMESETVPTDGSDGHSDDEDGLQLPLLDIDAAMESQTLERTSDELRFIQPATEVDAAVAESASSIQEAQIVLPDGDLLMETRIPAEVSYENIVSFGEQSVEEDVELADGEVAVVNYDVNEAGPSVFIERSEGWTENQHVLPSILSQESSFEIPYDPLNPYFDPPAQLVPQIQAEASTSFEAYPQDVLPAYSMPQGPAILHLGPPTPPITPLRAAVPMALDTQVLDMPPQPAFVDVHPAINPSSADSDFLSAPPQADMSVVDRDRQQVHLRMEAPPSPPPSPPVLFPSVELPEMSMSTDSDFVAAMTREAEGWWYQRCISWFEEEATRRGLEKSRSAQGSPSAEKDAVTSTDNEIVMGCEERSSTRRKFEEVEGVEEDMEDRDNMVVLGAKRRRRELVDRTPSTTTDDEPGSSSKTVWAAKRKPRALKEDRTLKSRLRMVPLPRGTATAWQAPVHEPAVTSSTPTSSSSEASSSSSIPPSHSDGAASTSETSYPRNGRRSFDDMDVDEEVVVPKRPRHDLPDPREDFMTENREEKENVPALMMSSRPRAGPNRSQDMARRRLEKKEKEKAARILERKKALENRQ